jgi:flagellar protein FlgJ
MTNAVTLPGAPLPFSTTPQPRQDDPAMAEARRAAEEFESVFLAQMLAPMFEGLQTDGLGGGGMGEEIFRPMLIERYAQALSQSGGVGLADSIVSELMRMQAAAAQVPEAADGSDR